MRFLFLTALTAALGLGGCATPMRYQATVSALVAQDFQAGRTQGIVATKAQEGDLGFMEVKAQAERALTAAGLTISASGPFDIGVFIEYGIGAPRTVTSNYSIPIWGQTGVASSTTTGQIQTYGSSGTYSSTTTNTPTYGIVGAQTGTISDTVYDRFLTLRAFDLPASKKDGKLHPAWQTEVRSSGTSNDLRVVVPFMLKAAATYAGRSSATAVTVISPDDDAQVAFIRSGVPVKP